MYIHIHNYLLFVVPVDKNCCGLYTVHVTTGYNNNMYMYSIMHTCYASLQHCLPCCVYAAESCQVTERGSSDIAAEGAQVDREADTGEADHGHADGAAGTVRTGTHIHMQKVQGFIQGMRGSLLHSTSPLKCMVDKTPRGATLE